MTSLATRLKESQFLVTNFAADANVSIIRSFFLPTKHVKPDTKCHVSSCLIEEERKKDPSQLSSLKEVKEWTHPMCFCFSCDRTMHLVCLQLNLESFAAQSAPFLCPECITKPANEAAQKYYKSGKWGNGTSERRKSFLKIESIEQYPNLIGDQSTELTWEPDDIQAIKDFTTDPVIAKYNAEMEALGRHYREYRTSSENKIKEMQQKIEELERSRQTSSSHYFTAAPFSSTLKSSADSNPANVSTCESILKKYFLSLQSDKTTSNANRTSPFQTSETLRPSTSLASDTLRPPNINIQFAQQQQQRSPIINLNTPNDQTYNLDESNLSPSERILLNTTRACLESVNAQKQTAATKLLDLKRKALPKLSNYKGDPRGWITFKKEVRRYQESGLYDDEIVKLYVQGALQDDAKRRVDDLVDTATLEEVMKVLETSFGHTPIIIKSIEEDILKIKLKGELVRSDVVMINSLIQSYFTTCRYANVQRINSNMLAEHIVEQLDVNLRILFRQHCVKERPYTETVLPDLDMVYSFLETISSSLDVKQKDKKDKPAQMHFITSSTFSGQTRANDYRFQIRDIAIATHQGYNMSVVNSLTKRCYCCDKTSHFTIECYRFKDLTDQQRNQIIADKNLCRNCLLATDHSAQQCNVKPHCGRKISEFNFCKEKHHAILHTSGSNSGPNRNRSTSNSQRAQTSYDQSKNVDSNDKNSNSDQTNQIAVSAAQTQSVTNAANTTATVNPCFKYAVTAPFQNQCISLSTGRTIKLFKNKFFGPAGSTLGYSIGDSGSEITIMRDDLREQLGIEGKHTSLSMQWTDSQVRTIPAIEVMLKVQGLNKSDKQITLNNCYALSAEYFSLPARSLNVENLKARYPYLRPAKFDSYVDAVPILLIGSLHASCIEAIAPVLQRGICKPVGIKTRLGWSIYGGSSKSLIETHVVASIAKYVEDQVQSTKEVQNLESNTKESLEIKEKPAHIIDNDRRATELIQNEIQILPSRTVEVPLILDVLENHRMNKKRKDVKERNLPPTSKELEPLNVVLDDQFIERISPGMTLNPLIYPQHFAPVRPREHPLVKIMLVDIYEKYNQVCLKSQVIDLIVNATAKCKFKNYLIFASLTQKIFATLSSTLFFPAIFIGKSTNIITNMSNDVSYCTYWSVQLSNIQSFRNLHSIIDKLASTLKTMLAVYRDFDFRHVVFGETAFVTLMSRTEAEYLIEFCHELLDNQLITAKMAMVSPSSFNVVKCIVPVAQRSIMLSNINSNLSVDQLSDYLNEISSFFCENITVTSIRLVMDKRRHRLRSFAFVDCVSLDDVSHFDHMQVSFGKEQRFLTCTLSESIPILLHNSDLHLISTDTHGERIIQRNLLSTIIETGPIAPGNNFLMERQVNGGERPEDLVVVVRRDA